MAKKCRFQYLLDRVTADEYQEIFMERCPWLCERYLLRILPGGAVQLSDWETGEKLPTPGRLSFSRSEIKQIESGKKDLKRSIGQKLERIECAAVKKAAGRYGGERTADGPDFHQRVFRGRLRAD